MEEVKLPPKNLTVMEMKQKRNELCFKCGQHQFNKAVIEAELLQFNQELLNLSNEIAKAEKAEPPVKIAPEPEVIPASV